MSTDARKTTKAVSRTRARLLILNHIAQFSLQRRVGGEPFEGLEDCAFSGSAKDALPGDLVALQAAPYSKWYLGWLLERRRPEGWKCDQFVVESVEDGEIAEWHDVGLIHYHRGTVARHPEWRWTDEQHDFADRWYRVCRQDKGAYMYQPMAPVFEAKAVELAVHVHLGLDPTVVRETFPNWRRTSKKAMGDFYDRASAALRSKTADRITVG